MRGWIAAFLCATCFAQDPSKTEPDIPRATVDLSVNVKLVIAPTTVLDKHGDYVNGLQLQDFTLYDNNKPQRITHDVAFQPISLVVAVETSSMLNEILPKIQRLGTTISDLLAGQEGEVALVAFDGRVRVVQEFTNESTKLNESLKKLTPGSSSSRLIDAVNDSVRLLKSRPDNRRKVILCISERRDRASDGRLRDSLEAAQFANVTIYSINISHMLALATGDAPLMGPNPIPTVGQHVPDGAPQTPTSVDIQRNSGNFVPLFQSIFLATKSLFVDDTLDVFTKFTGGKEYYFLKQKALESAVSAIGEDLHSQYLLSYSPSNQDEGGFHDIKVVVNRPGLEVRSRVGYWVAARPQP